MQTQRPPQKGWSCWMYMVTLIGLCLMSIAFYTGTGYIKGTELSSNVAKWRAKGSSTYNVTIVGWVEGPDRQNTIYILEGKIIRQTNPYLYPELKEAPIDALFKQLSGCIDTVLRCSVEYDPDYGYPTLIDWPCLDACPRFRTRLIALHLGRSLEEF